MFGSNSNTHSLLKDKKKSSPVLTVLYINLNAMDLPFVDSSTVFFSMLPWNLHFFLFTRLRQAD